MANLYSEHYIKLPESHCYSTTTYFPRAKKGAFQATVKRINPCIPFENIGKY